MTWTDWEETHTHSYTLHMEPEWAAPSPVQDLPLPSLVTPVRDPRLTTEPLCVSVWETHITSLTSPNNHINCFLLRSSTSLCCFCCFCFAILSLCFAIRTLKTPILKVQIEQIVAHMRDKNKPIRSATAKKTSTCTNVSIFYESRSL